MSQKIPTKARSAAAADKRKAAHAASKTPRKSVRPKPEHVAEQQLEPRGEATLPKKDQLIALLQSASGTTIDAMTSATGWQPHTVRGVISGVLRKRLGLNVVCEKTDHGNRYKITASA